MAFVSSSHSATSSIKYDLEILSDILASQTLGLARLVLAVVIEKQLENRDPSAKKWYVNRLTFRIVIAGGPAGKYY